MAKKKSRRHSEEPLDPTPEEEPGLVDLEAIEGGEPFDPPLGDTPAEESTPPEPMDDPTPEEPTELVQTVVTGAAALNPALPPPGPARMGAGAWGIMNRLTDTQLASFKVWAAREGYSSLVREKWAELFDRFQKTPVR